MSITNLTTEQRQNNVTLSIDRVKEALAKAHNTHPSNWLTAKEACELLGISRPTLLAGRKKGKYTYVMHNQSLRIKGNRRSYRECNYLK